MIHFLKLFSKFQLNDWQLMNNNIFTYEILPLQFPEDNKNDWKKLFKPCASQRLFLPVNNINILHKILIDQPKMNFRHF